MARGPIPTTRDQLLQNKSLEPRAKEWLAAIPTNVDGHRMSFDFGEPIKPPTGVRLADHTVPVSAIGIILAGEAEIFAIEESLAFQYNDKKKEALKCIAYRPIRILGAGELFGDFVVIDRMLDRGPARPSRPQEKWEVCAGRRCVLLKQTMPSLSEKIAEMVDKPFEGIKEKRWSVFRPDLLLHELCSMQTGGHGKPCETDVFFFSSEHVERPKNQTDPIQFFYVKLLEQAWVRARLYRDGLNTFNVHVLARFRSDFQDVISRLKKRKYRDNTRAVFQYIFADALYDALNRPFRDEPVFSTDPRFQSEEMRQRLKVHGIADPNDVLISNYRTSIPGDFYFPIDFFNYHINLHSNLWGLRQDHIAHLGGHRVHEDSSTNTRYLYKDAVNELLAELSRTFEKDKADGEPARNVGNLRYLFESDLEVACSEIKGATMRQLVLHFQKKKP